MDSCMRPVLYFFLLSIFLFSFTRGTHPIYVSVTEMELNAKEKRLEISCKSVSYTHLDVYKRQALDTHIGRNQQAKTTQNPNPPPARKL